MSRTPGTDRRTRARRRTPAPAAARGGPASAQGPAAGPARPAAAAATAPPPAGRPAEDAGGRWPAASAVRKTGAPLSVVRAMLGAVETRSVSPVFVGRTRE